MLFSILIILFLFSLALYVLPIIIAIKRKHPNAIGIILVDLLFGWTLLGWGIALIWSVTDLTVHQYNK